MTKNIRMANLKNITTVYKTYNKYPSLNSAKFLSKNNPYVINSAWTINDLVSSKSKVASINFHFDQSRQIILKSLPIMRDEEVLMDVYSASLKYRAICLERKNSEAQSKDSKINLIHLWSDDIFMKSINLSELDIHGPIYKRQSQFGNFQWIDDGNRLIYIAEAKKPKKLSYFQHTPAESASKNIEIGNQYKSKKDFGEQLSDITNPVVCVLDVEAEKIEVFDSNTLCSGSTIGVVCPQPDGCGFVFTSFKQMPYDLGLIYCDQRCCDLWHYDFATKDITKIGSDNKSKGSPSYSPTGDCVIWIENDAFGAHRQCQRLMRYDFATGLTTVIVDIVRDPAGGFPGIYTPGLTDNCWTRDGRHVFLTSQNRCRSQIVLIDMESASARILDSSESSSSEILLDMNDHFLLVKVSSISTVPYLAIVDIDSALADNRLRLIPVSTVHRLDSVPDCKVLDHEPTFAHPKYGKTTYQSIYVSSNKAEEPRPLILMLHGGPHSSFDVGYTTFTACAVELGYNLLMVNYRGSLGFGQDFVESLLGYIGEMDVSDCIQACEDVLSNFASQIDTNNIFLYGGSHGGFLGAHVAAKYASKVAATVIRNPVINLPSMLTASDIPDWIYTEIGLNWEYNYLLNHQLLMNMWDKSPLKFVDGVKCPILVMIGQEDKRVPPSQGMELHKALLARSIRTELYIYPKDSHPLSSLEASSDCFVNIMLWFGDNVRK